jgi:hypothetical protein
MKNLCIRPECTSSGYGTCEASILLLWTENDVWGVSEHFANLQHNKRCNTCVSGLNALFGVPKLQIWFRNQSIHSTPLDPR